MKKRLRLGTVFSMYERELFCFGSANRASTFASTAIKASVCIDYINSVFFRDSTNGASVCASTASNAFFFVDLICHNRNSVLDGDKIINGGVSSRR